MDPNKHETSLLLFKKMTLRSSEDLFQTKREKNAAEDRKLIRDDILSIISRRACSDVKTRSKSVNSRLRVLHEWMLDLSLWLFLCGVAYV